MFLIIKVIHAYFRKLKGKKEENKTIFNLTHAWNLDIQEKSNCIFYWGSFLKATIFWTYYVVEFKTPIKVYLVIALITMTLYPIF